MHDKPVTKTFFFSFNHGWWKYQCKIRTQNYSSHSFSGKNNFYIRKKIPKWCTNETISLLYEPTIKADDGHNDRFWSKYARTARFYVLFIPHTYLPNYRCHLSPNTHRFSVHDLPMFWIIISLLIPSMGQSFKHKMKLLY